MNPDLLPLVSFVLITTFTPGPNNISSASMGILVGYRKTLPYLVGIAVGFFTLMMLCGWISKTLLLLLPSFEGYLRIFGAGYILYLAWHTYRASYDFKEGDQKALGFFNGLLLQILNPKAIVFGLTLYSTFLADIEFSFLTLMLSAAILAVTTFSAISTWTLFGAAIRTYLRNQTFRRAINAALSLMLVYIAVEISGLLELIKK
jgi:cysteine/O-acetylserine efflux protein